MSIWEESGSFNLNLENWLISEEEIPSRYKLEMKYKSVSCCYKMSWKLRATKNIVYICVSPKIYLYFGKTISKVTQMQTYRGQETQQILVSNHRYHHLSFNTAQTDENQNEL